MALLLAVAIALTGKPDIQVHCTYDMPLPGPYLGMATASSPQDGLPHIWMLPEICSQAYHRTRYGLWVFAHEMLHIRPNKSEEWTQKWDNWYAENVVRWKMRALSPLYP